MHEEVELRNACRESLGNVKVVNFLGIRDTHVIVLARMPAVPERSIAALKTRFRQPGLSLTLSIVALAEVWIRLQCLH